MSHQRRSDLTFLRQTETCFHVSTFFHFFHQNKNCRSQLALKRKFSNFDSALNAWWCEQKSVSGDLVMKFSADQECLISKQRFEFLVFLKIINSRMASLKCAKIAWVQLFMTTNRVNISNWNAKETNRLTYFDIQLAAFASIFLIRSTDLFRRMHWVVLNSPLSFTCLKRKQLFSIFKDWRSIKKAKRKVKFSAVHKLVSWLSRSKGQHFLCITCA